MGKNQAKSVPKLKRDSRSPRVHAGKSLYRKATNCSRYRDINLSPMSFDPVPCPDYFQYWSC